MPRGRPKAARDEQERRMIIPAFGPPIPIVSHRDFNIAVSQKELEVFWTITGPSAMNNISRGRPMWAVIACAYAEGLHHATKLLAELHERGELEKDPVKAYKEVPVGKAKKP